MNEQNMAVKVALDSWNGTVKRTDALFDSLTDEQLQKEIAPGRNRGIYLLGHLTAVHDAMLPLMGFGDSLHPELLESFIKSPDNSLETIPSAQELRENWKEVNSALDQHFSTLQHSDWLDRHTSVSPEDFEKEPHRNRLNALIGRTNHMGYHLGQLALLKDGA